MAGPLIPFIDGASYQIPLAFLKYVPLLGDLVDPRDPPSIKPFGTLVAIGVYLGAWMTMRRARERKLDETAMNDFIFWVVATGFVLSHVIDSLAYYPARVARDPLYLLRIWDGLSSYGGFVGAVVGAVAWRLYRRKPILEYVDVCVSAFPLAWVFGRMGCSIVHDHPGAASNAWFAVRYPAAQLVAGYQGRYDLGLYEMVLTIPLAVACHLLWRRRPLRPEGFYVGVTLTAYAPVRFLLDFLRVPYRDMPGLSGDPRYLGLTPAQWACFGAIAVGGYFLWRTRGAQYVRTGVAAADPDPADDEQADDTSAERAPGQGTDDDQVAPDPEVRPKPRKKRKKKRAPQPLADG